MKKLINFLKEYFSDGLNITAVVGLVLHLVAAVIIIYTLGWLPFLGLFLWTWASNIQEAVGKQRQKRRDAMSQIIGKGIFR